MRTLEIDSQTTLEHLLKELQTTEEDGLELTVVPELSSFLENPINKKIIEKVAKQLNKKVVFPILAAETTLPEEKDDLGFIEGEDIVSKVPMEEVDKMIAPAANSTTQAVGTTKKTFKFNLKNKWLFIGGGFVAFLLVLGLALFFLPSATVTLALNSQSKEAQAELVADEAVKTVSTRDGKLPLVTKEISKEAEDQLVASGKKTVGTTSKGRVTLYNLDTSSEKVFLASTTVLTPVATSSATFKLDADVTVAKAPIIGTPSSAGVNVTAYKAGVEGNLVANTTFTINTISNLVYAKNDVVFSGGATKQITVASVDDKNTLRAKIVGNLSEDASNQLTSGNSSNLIIKDGLETTVTKETYTPSSLETETTNLKADIVVKSKIYLVNKDDLKKILLEKLKNGTADFKVNEDNLSLSAALLSKETDSSLKITGKIKASLVPKLNENDIKNHLKGKSLSEVKSYLTALKNVTEFKVDLAPSYFRILGVMPFFASKIKLSYQ